MLGAGPALGAPTENTTEPPTGWPSSETTRQLSTCVPCASAGSAMVRRSARPGLSSSFVVPSGATSRSTSGATGSLKVSVSWRGAAATIAPSAGSLPSNDACAHATDAVASSIIAASMAAMMGARRSADLIEVDRLSTVSLLSLGQQRQARRRLLVIMRVLALLRDLDPAMHAALAFLNHREVELAADLEIVGQ